MSWSWSIPIISGVGAVIALIASKPERKIAAIIAAFFILLASAWSGILLYSKSETQNTIRQHAYKQLEDTTRNLLGVISHITIEASDGSVPDSENDFFSSNTAALICNYLDLDAKAPILPERSWIKYLSETTIKVEKDYDDIITKYGAQIPSDLLQSIINVKESFFVTFPRQIENLRHLKMVVNQPKILCPGLDKNVEDSLSCIESLYKQIWQITGSKEYPMPAREHNLDDRIGKSRINVLK